MSKQKRKDENLIASNKKAFHDYQVNEQFEAGLVLEGWEVKSIRAGRVQLKDSYVKLKDGEAWLIGSHISPLPTASTHIDPDPTRTRKLLLNAKELSKLRVAVEREGLTVVPLKLVWRRQLAKLKIAIAQGKKSHDKRASAKRKDWERERHRILKGK